MDNNTWAETDHYLEATVLSDAASFEPIRAAQSAAGLPDIAVSATQGKFLSLLAKIARAERVLEIGTLGGYSTAWLAEAVGPAGSVISLEFDPEHARVAEANLAQAGYGDRVAIIVGAALDTLPTLSGHFEFVFIDADKSNSANYLEWALRLTKPGSVIVLDNVIRRLSQEGPDADGTRDALQMLGTDPRLDATAIQTVGSKGHDGFAVALVR